MIGERLRSWVLFAGAFLLAALLLAPTASAAKKPAVLVKDINPGGKRSSSTGGAAPGSLVFANVAGTLFFAATDRKHGNELWRSDGTRRGTRLVKDIRPGPRPCAASKRVCRGQGASSNPSALTAVGRTLYFTAYDPVHGIELWRSDGTSRGTRMVKDVLPGNSFNGSGPAGLTDVAGTLFFTVTDPPHAMLWRSDGSAAGTTLVKDFGQTLGGLTAAGRTLFFVSAGGGLWSSDGTASGTALIKQTLGPFQLTDVAGTLFFLAGDGTHFGVWRSDGTTAGTALVKELHGITNGLTAVGSTLYFISEPDLWRSDGTEPGTIPLINVGPIPEGCCGQEGVFPQIADVRGTLYVVRNALGGTLLRTDGTPGGTKELRASLRPDFLTAVGKTLYFVGTDKRHGQEVWQSNGTRKGTRLVRDIRRGKRSARPQELTAVGKTLFFSAHDNRHGYELWRAGPPTKR
ncbi:MAG TPA: ELWxxDGT repeat protein [Solirubrobacterales bacterium]|jgi:ELWxxDGT repeat protein